MAPNCSSKTQADAAALLNEGAESTLYSTLQYTQYTTVQYSTVLLREFELAHYIT